MGSRDPQKQLWNYQVNLDKRVRSDHPLRRIDETLRLDFVRGDVARYYGRKGNVYQMVLQKLSAFIQRRIMANTRWARCMRVR
jgi:hypothetical protein